MKIATAELQVVAMKEIGTAEVPVKIKKIELAGKGEEGKAGKGEGTGTGKAEGKGGGKTERGQVSYFFF